MVRIQLQQALAPHDQPNRRTRLRIGRRVGQVIIGGKALIALRGTQATSDVQTLGAEMIPDILTSLVQAFIIELTRKIGNCAK